MNWLNRLDDALDDAAQASQRISDRSRERQDTQRAHKATTASLSDAVAHLRPPASGTATRTDNDASTAVASSHGSLPATKAAVSTSRTNKSSPQQQHQNSFISNHIDVSFVVDERHAASSSFSAKPTKSSPWGRALDSIVVGSEHVEETKDTRNKTHKRQRRSKQHDETSDTPVIQNRKSAPSERSGVEEEDAMLLPSSLSPPSATYHTEYHSDELEEVSLLENEEASNGKQVREDVSTDGSASIAPVGDNGKESGEESSLPQHVLLQSDLFEVDSLLKSWNTNSNTPLDPRLNCYGVFHVRILRAQRLPCPVGSSVHSVVSLPPWQGKVRTPKTEAFSGGGSSTLDVRADWSESENASVSMVHAYTSEDSPIPSIHAVLVFSASLIGMLEFEMCFVEIPCDALLESPMKPFCGWFETTLHESSGEHVLAPLVQIEAAFEPEEKEERSLHPNPTTEALVEDESSLEEETSLSISPTNPPGDVPPSPVSKASTPVPVDDRSHSDFSTSLSSFRHLDTVISSSKTHLLNLKTFYTFARCSVCSRSIMSGLRKRPAYRCEECGVDCCSDCRLQVDFRLPCGSKSARLATENSVQAQFTAEKIMSIIAPIPETEHPVDPSVTISNESSSFQLAKTVASATDLGIPQGIGLLRAKIVKAVALSSPIAPYSFPSDVFKSEDVARGDYYVRIKCSSGESARTKTVQGAGRPKFLATLNLRVPSYGVDFIVELIDAASDTVVGASVLPVKVLLQEQRDLFAGGTIVPFVWIFNGPVAFNRTRHLVLELRKSKKQTAHAFFSKETRGDVAGVVEMDLVLEEDMNALYGKDPYECPPKPPDSLDLAILQSHISRLSGFVSYIKTLVGVYSYVVSWETPILTLGCLVLFLHICLTSDLEYIGALPFFILLVTMAFLGFDRAQGRFQRRFANDALKKMLERNSSGKAKVHRPIGMVKVRVQKGRHLRSPELGLPGSAGCRVSLDLSKFIPDQELKKAKSADKALSASHELGTTESIYSSDPVWKHLKESAEAKRLRQLLPFDGAFFAPIKDDRKGEYLEFPVLQPLKIIKSEHVLQPWSTSSAAIVFEVRFSDVVSIGIPGTEYSLGEVLVPVSNLISQGNVAGWFKISEVGKESEALCEVDGAGDFPQLWIEATWIPPSSLLGTSIEQEKEASVVVHDEMIRAAVISEQQKVTLFGTSVGAFNTVAGLSNNLLSIQNALGTFLDAFECLQNLFNFSDPYKSTVVIMVLLLLWIVLSTIPTRWLFVGAGVGQFGVTLHSRLSKRKSKLIGKHATEAAKATVMSPSQGKSSVITWISNAFLGLPSDEDLRRTYHWNSQRIAALEAQNLSKDKRSACLTNLWHAKWHGEIDIVMPPRQTGNRIHRKKAFGVIQGHRFLWWDSVEDFDGGNQTIGQLFFQGHSGLATPSPLETRTLKHDETDRVTAVFGRGRSSQERVTLLCSSAFEKENFEKAVFAAIDDKID